MPRTTSRAINRTIPTGVMLLLVSTSSQAVGVPGIDFRAQVGYWGAEPSGTVASGDDDFRVQDDLNLDRNGSGFVMGELEHPVPILPNLRLRHRTLDDSATGTISTTREFGPVQFTNNQRVRSSYDMEMTDATFYYSPLNNWISIDIGLTARHIDLQVEVENQSSGQRDQAGGSIWLPMGHLGARFDLPLTGVYAGGELNAISVDDESMEDVRVTLGWQTTSNFGVEIGYQRMEFETDEVDDLRADVKFEGPYAAATVRF